MISETGSEKSTVTEKDIKVLDHARRTGIEIKKTMVKKTCKKRKMNVKRKCKSSCKEKLKIINKNQNLQVVNMKLGCGIKKGKRLKKKRKIIRRIIRRVVRKEAPVPMMCKEVPVPVINKLEQNFLKESVCVNFLVYESRTPQRLWTAIGVKPTGSLVLDNKSQKSMTLIVHQFPGEVITQEVKPQTQLSLTVENIALIEVTCFPSAMLHPSFTHSHHSDKSTEKSSACCGDLRLHLFIPLSSHEVQHHPKHAYY